jgi:hypothetical protein
MKQKSDFITNSSSASYILTLKADVSDMSLERFKKIFNEYIEIYKNDIYKNNKIRFWDGVNVHKVDKNMFEVVDWTSMHNDNDDIPDYMRDLLIESFVGDRDWGFKVEKFRIDDDH